MFHKCDFGVGDEASLLTVIAGCLENSAEVLELHNRLKTASALAGEHCLRLAAFRFFLQPPSSNMPL